MIFLKTIKVNCKLSDIFDIITPKICFAHFPIISNVELLMKPFPLSHLNSQTPTTNPITLIYYEKHK